MAHPDGPNISPANCPKCGYKNMDTATDVEGTAVAPKPGDVSICWGCGGLLVFDEGMRMYAPSRAELDRIFEEAPPDTLRKIAVAKLAIMLRRHK